MHTRGDFSICRKVLGNLVPCKRPSLWAGQRNLAGWDSTAVFPRHQAVQWKASAWAGASEWKQNAECVKEVHLES